MGKVIILTLLLLASCGKKLDYQIHKGLSGSINKAEFDCELDYVKDDRIALFNFAGISCYSCFLEIKEFYNGLRNKEVGPTKIRLVTVLVGSNESDAIDWLKDMADIGIKIPWEIAVDPSGACLKKFQSLPMLPTNVVYDGRVIFNQIGVHTKKWFEDNYTGEWE